MKPFTIDKNPTIYKLKECFYCDRALPAARKEHIFNSCWAGTHKTGSLICNECNWSFSDAVDKAFAPYTKYIMNAWNFKGERHDKVPSISTDSAYVIEPGAKPVKKPVIEASEQEDGAIRFRADTASRGEARRLLLDSGEVEKRIGRDLTPEDKELIKKKIREAEFTGEKAGKIPVQETLNINDEYRSAAHTLLKCLGRHDPEAATSAQTESIRDFARHGNGSWEQFAIQVEPTISAFSGISSMNVKYNAAEIFYSEAHGKIVGTLTVLGRVKRSVVLSNDYHGPNKVISVCEEGNGPGIVKAMSVVANTAVDSGLSFFRSDFKAPTAETLVKQFAAVVQDAVSIDASYARLSQTLMKLTRKYGTVSLPFLDECANVCSEFLLDLSYATGTDFNKEEIMENLWKCGFEQLKRNCIGIKLEDSQVQRLLAAPIIALMDKMGAKP